MSEKQPFLVLDRHVSMGHIITTVMILISGVSYAVTMDSRIIALEKQDLKFEQRMAEQVADRRYDMQEIKSTLRRIEDKVDQKADKAK